MLLFNDIVKKNLWKIAKKKILSHKKVWQNETLIVLWKCKCMHNVNCSLDELKHATCEWVG